MRAISFEACTNSYTVTSTNGFSAGDTVLILPMTGSQIDTSDTPNFGKPGSIEAGIGQLDIVADVPNGSTLILKNKPRYQYFADGGYVQIIRIPQFTNVTVGGLLQAQPWIDVAHTGGVLVLSAYDTITLDADIDVSGLGFYGGNTSNNGGQQSFQGYYCTGASALGGFKGYDVATGVPIGRNAGRGAIANGGGGGNAHNAGGGGGSLLARGGMGGDQTNTPPFIRDQLGGLGGWGGFDNELIMGGGGGGGHENDGGGGDGAAGGGIVIIFAKALISNGHMIRAQGLTADPSTLDGAGGGGAGGVVYLQIDTIPQTLEVDLDGGNGGDADAKSGQYGYGPGGGGSGGVEFDDGSSTIEWHAMGGSSGKLMHCTDATINGSSYGAQDGGNGARNGLGVLQFWNDPFADPSANTHFFSICSGDSVAISASNADSYLWTPSAGLKDSTSAQITVSPDTTTVYSVEMTLGTCTFTDTVLVAVGSKLNATFVGSDTVCNGSTVTYYASAGNQSGVSYRWLSNGMTTIFTADSLVLTWDTVGTTTIGLMVSNGTCTTSSTQQIVVGNGATPEITGDTMLCFGDSATLRTTSSYLTYLWHPNDESTPTINVGQSGLYSVDVTSAGGCTGSSNALRIVVNPLPAIPTITRNGNTLSSSPAAFYSWSFNGSSILGDTEQNIVPAQDGSYIVTVTDSNGCSATSLPYNYVIAGSATVSVPAISGGNPGSIVSIPVTLDSANGLAESGAGNYLAKISLDASMLTPVNPTGVLNGDIWIVTLTGTTPNSTGLLQNIAALALDSGNCSNIIIDTFYFPGAKIDVTTENGSFCLTGECRPWITSTYTAFTIKRVSPNPSAGSFTIEYHVASEGPVSLAIEDYLGRTSKLLKNEWSAPGDANETYTIEEVPSGVYRLLLRSGSSVLSKMLVVAK